MTRYIETTCRDAPFAHAMHQPGFESEKSLNYSDCAYAWGVSSLSIYSVSKVLRQCSRLSILGRTSLGRTTVLLCSTFPASGPSLGLTGVLDLCIPRRATLSCLPRVLIDSVQSSSADRVESAEIE